MKKIKAWYDDIDSATLQRIKTYSAFNDAKSKNLMCQTIYEYREKEIQDFKETNHELALESIARQKRITELEAQIEKMKSYIKACWVEENLNDYSSYITNTRDEFKDLVHELNEEIRNGR